MAERSRLLLDPEARSAYLQDVSVSRLPQFIAGSGLAMTLLRSILGGLKHLCFFAVVLVMLLVAAIVSPGE